MSDVQTLKNTALTFVHEALGRKAVLIREAEVLRERMARNHAAAEAVGSARLQEMVELYRGAGSNLDGLELTPEQREVHEVVLENGGVRNAWADWWQRVGDFEVWARAQAATLDAGCAVAGVAICPAGLERQVEGATSC